MCIRDSHITVTFTSLLLTIKNLVYETNPCNLDIVQVFHLLVIDVYKRQGVYKRFDALADFLGCSKKALAIRMKQLGLLKKEYLDNPLDLVTVYPEVSEL